MPQVEESGRSAACEKQEMGLNLKTHYVHRVFVVTIILYTGL